jgi:tetratricopeptide (TPR) repeat protein
VAPAIVGEAVEADLPPMYRLPPVEADAAPDSTPPSWAADVQENRSEAANVAPVPEAAPDEMLDELEEFWSGEFDGDAARDASGAAAGAMPYTPTLAELSRQLLPSVRKAYALARHGAVYAAQAEFIQVLRRIAQARDATEGVDVHSRALAAGLRALDEADDFMPQGAQLEAEMNVASIASSHRTPVLRGNCGLRTADCGLKGGGTQSAIRNPKSEIQAHEAIALYHQYGRKQLALAVAGEQAGSMALHGLGKLQNRLAHDSAGDLRHERKAMTMFLSALDAGPSNHLAANEIGVLLARGGRPAEAAAKFRQAIDLAPTSTTYRNLAVVERQLGAYQQADANDRYANELAARDRATGAVSRSHGVRWVTPRELARNAPPQSLPPAIAPMARIPVEAKARVEDRPWQTAGIGPQRDGGRSGAAGTIARLPQKLIPSVFR